MKKFILKFCNRLDKAYIPILLFLFSCLLFGIMFTSVYQKKMEIKEGQLAEKTIRANKNIENTYDTKQKKKLAAESVTPEYVYQEDIATNQHNWTEKLFKLIKATNDRLDKEYQEKNKKLKREKQFLNPQ